MSHEYEVHESITVAEDDVTVEKSFVEDEFPVPAVKFVIESTSTEPVDIRLTDQIPESFPMDCVGFHPDYENDNWTAYKDHRVEFVRTLAPEETLTTVYGIRIDATDEDRSSFLTEPYLDLVSTEERGGEEAEDVEDIVGEDGNEVVREVFAGDRDAVPGMDEVDENAEDLDFEDPVDDPIAADPLAVDAADDEPIDLDVTDPLAADDGETDSVTEDDVSEPLQLDDPLAEAEVDVTDAEEDGDETVAIADAPEPRAVDSDTRSAVRARPADAGSLSLLTEETNLDTEPEDVTSDDSEEPAETVALDTAAPVSTPEASAEGIAAALATEIREGRVDDDDLAVLKRELGLGVPTSVDVRINRLQSQMENLAAYSDALAVFLDEEGTGVDLITDVREQIESLDDSVTTLETALSAAESDRFDLRDEIDATTVSLQQLEGDIETNTDALERTAADVDELSESLSSLDTEMGDVRADLADLDGDIVAARESLSTDLDTLRDELGDDVDAVRSDLADLRATLDDLEDVRSDLADIRADLGDLEGVRSDVDEVQADIEELELFRERLGSAFGGN